MWKVLGETEIEKPFFLIVTSTMRRDNHVVFVAPSCWVWLFGMAL